MRRSFTMLPVLALMTLPASAAPETYKLDPDHSVVIFEAKHQDTSTVVGWFTDIDASIVVDRDNPANSTLEAYVNATSGTTREAERDKWILDSVLKASTYPAVEFKSTKVAPTGPLSADVTGTLSIAGVTLPDFKLSTIVVDKGDVIGFSAVGALSRKAIGSTAYATVAGDEVTIRVEGEARQQ